MDNWISDLLKEGESMSNHENLNEWFDDLDDIEKFALAQMLVVLENNLDLMIRYLSYGVFIRLDPILSAANYWYENQEIW